MGWYSIFHHLRRWCSVRGCYLSWLTVQSRLSPVKNGLPHRRCCRVRSAWPACPAEAQCRKLKCIENWQAKAGQERGSLEKILLCLPHPGRIRLVTLIWVSPGMTWVGVGFDGFLVEPRTASLRVAVAGVYRGLALSQDE